MRRYSGPESVRQRLNRFAIATIVVGVGLLVLARPADAEVVYTPTNITIGPNARYNLDLNNDGITDFTISSFFQGDSGPCGAPLHATASVAERPASGNGAAGSPPSALGAGDHIGPKQSFYRGTGTLESDVMTRYEFCEIQNDYSGKWRRSLRYLGLALQINGETYYGWAELQIMWVPHFGGTPFTAFAATLTGYAYETIPGMKINAGQTTEADGSSALSPGPANRGDSGLVASATDPMQAVSVGTLARGAQEVPLWRRKEPAGAAPENS